MSGHSSPGSRRGRGSRARGTNRSYRSTPSPNSSSAGSHFSPSVSTHAVPSTPLYPQPSHPQGFVPMTQFQQPYGAMPFPMGFPTVLPTSHPSQTEPQSAPLPMPTFHPFGGSYPFPFIPTPQAHHSSSSPGQNVEATPSKPIETDQVDGRTNLSYNQSCDYFIPAVGLPVDQTKIWKRRYTEPWLHWDEVPEITRQMWLEEFNKKYKWQPEESDRIWITWNASGRKSFKNSLNKIKSGANTGAWMDPDVHRALQEKWNDEQYKKMAEQNKKNRASMIGGSIHTGGSIPFTESRRRMARELNREPTEFEHFRKTHTRKDDQGGV
ncbi:uncharacterized protein LOC127787865 isoform X3 [Diospyros lotus]|uniref:uncharacterized protein LOC127787865 isoform X3 n=1 Tax=Diospyros lotus TaxID=55363 RepID=UPI00225BB24B|nr:uncharacterized protein LOC127787865 isoform X3 [Diospyros lotus]